MIKKKLTLDKQKANELSFKHVTQRENSQDSHFMQADHACIDHRFGPSYITLLSSEGPAAGSGWRCKLRLIK